MLTYNTNKYFEFISKQFDLPYSELCSTWSELVTEFCQGKWELEQENHKLHSSHPYYDLREDVIIRFGEEPSPEKSKLAVFYLNSLIRPKNGKSYYSNPSDWEWTDEVLANDIKEYLKDDTYRLVLVSSEILSWKIEMVLHVSNLLLPTDGKLTILLGVRNPFPLPNLFVNSYPSLKWKDAIVVGGTEYDTFLGCSMGIDYCLSSSYKDDKR
jgi:hypothetical protein